MRTWIVGAALLALVWPVAGAGQETMAGYLREEYSCIMCHTDKRMAFLEGVHSDRGITCADCHGGDPSAFEVETAHSKGFRGFSRKADAVGLCLSCHGDIALMRQYGLEPVTREEFLESRHGQRLLVAGDTAAPSCSDCHGSHAIFPRVDARSRINTLRVAETCAECHADRSRMPEEIPVNQFAEWRASAHGVALLEEHNTRSATCAACHSAHSALPPRVAEVANVCGHCHQVVRRAYFEGAHGAGARRGDVGVACTACHENHATRTPSPVRIEAVCVRCHEEGTPGQTTALALQELATSAHRAARDAEEAVEALRTAGEPTEDQEARLVTLNTFLQEMQAAVHTLDPERVGDLTRRAEALSIEIRQRSEVVEEQVWERRLVLIPLWLVILGGVALAIRKRRLLRRRRARRAETTGGAEPAPEAEGA